MLIVPPARASRSPAPSRPLAIFYRFTVEEAIENGDKGLRGARPHGSGDVSGVEMTLRADQSLPCRRSDRAQRALRRT
jgi:hypothetical protein